VKEGRDGRGSIYVFASGNGGSSDNCNFDGYTNSIYTISIGAVGKDNTPASYQEPCVAQLAVTYSSSGGVAIVRGLGPGGAWRIVRTDSTGPRRRTLPRAAPDDHRRRPKVHVAVRRHIGGGAAGGRHLCAGAVRSVRQTTPAPTHIAAPTR